MQWKENVFHFWGAAPKLEAKYAGELAIERFCGAWLEIFLQLLKPNFSMLNYIV